MNSTPSSNPWYYRIGPGLITACVVIGPGSITTSSSVGANNGYSMLWIVVVSVAFMMLYMTLGAKLGVVADRSAGDLIRKHAGSWLAILVGCCVFFIATAYQSGNNFGVASAFEAFSDSKEVIVGLIVAFNAIALMFLFAFKDLYRMLERLMMGFVGLMLVSFAINLVRLGPDLGEMAEGFIPSVGMIELDLLGLLGTTFVTTAAFYQVYLVRQKGWGESELQNGLMDARIGSVIMGVLTIMLMSTAAAGLYTGEPVVLKSPVDIAQALEATFGTNGKVIFCFGVFSAAYSSFLVNSMIGGFILSDGLGLGASPDEKWPRLFTAAALLTGMGFGIAAILFGFDLTPSLIMAQAVTVIGAPLIAAILFWLTSRKDIMGKHVNGPMTNLGAALGLLLLLGIAGYTAFVKIPDRYRSYVASASQNTAEESASSAEAEAINDDDE
ncbi:Divalent metal cation transporter MntH [Thalassoglobus neptunius]|uniref:Divalent metal cation transporter MntH n=1 Tax=Thalassoglobus neptunius TaxID=1938619 RepID=A0A5C5WAC4_9PLAN|nr:Nramp family divalent metal transporter [Thalassoglobus neptunius]TWT47105.1 Divalent metal cation transporter MntH [Thalassoglobus neptunius]